MNTVENERSIPNIPKIISDLSSTRPAVQGEAAHGDDDNDTKSSSFYSAISTLSKRAPSPHELQARTVMVSTRELDLAERVDGMFRILDLITEQGSGGLVDKIIIAQDQFGQFINELCPGSYRSQIKVDFHLLDKVAVKPVGVYGSKTEIVRLMRSIGAIDEEIENFLLASGESSSRIPKPNLRPGLYALFCPRQGEETKIYVIFWPEDTTWNDNASSTVARNRVTFLRYLSQITDQIIALISDEHCKALVWADEQDDTSTVLDVEDSERLFKFEVSKTNEQEENVELLPGFKINVESIRDSIPALGANGAKLKPRVIGGESKQAIMLSSHARANVDVRKATESYSQVRLQTLLNDRDTAIRFDTQLSGESIKILIDNGLRSRFRPAVEKWENSRASFVRDEEESKSIRTIELKKGIDADTVKVSLAVERKIVGIVHKAFPAIEGHRLGSACNGISDEMANESDSFLANMFLLHPNMPDDSDIRQSLDLVKWTGLTIAQGSFLKSKRIILLCLNFFPVINVQEEKEEFLRLLISDDMTGAESFLRELQKGNSSHRTPLDVLKNTAKSVIGWLTESNPSTGLLKESRDRMVRSMSDKDFVSKLRSTVEEQPLLQDQAEKSLKFVYAYLTAEIRKATSTVTSRVLFLQEKNCLDELSKEYGNRQRQMEVASRLELLSGLNSHEEDGATNHTIVLESVKPIYKYTNPHFELTLTHKIRKEPMVNYTIKPFQFTENDKQELQMQPDHFMVPSFSERISATFSLPIDYDIRHIYLLDDMRCLLIVDNQRGHLEIYLEVITSLDNAIQRLAGHKKRLHKDKMGDHIILAFDERKRMIAVCGCDPVKSAVHLHTFVFDETFTSLQGQGSPINLAPWYEELSSVQAMCFISGTEELALLEADGRTRIFSLSSQQFRPATLKLPSCPHTAISSPDGACLIALFKQTESGASCVLAYHWNSFGSKPGFAFDLPDDLKNVQLISSLVQRNNLHLLGVSLRYGTCQSARLKITRQATEYMFHEKGTKIRREISRYSTTHNCIMDCHSDVWIRFPVIPAITRETILSKERRKNKSLRFIASQSRHAFPPYFREMIQMVERSTRKPIGTALYEIDVTGEPFSSLVEDFQNPDWQHISSLMAGEWLVNLICLIPIHIAVARENRFIPLKDGVLTSEYERSLLGAEVVRIVDSLSFGWYESVFQSYMSTKPVRVVSSMGEQSVGKSYALNHLVDTSFAGSAMRTTEGVWMSVTPTTESLIVALDFEGVHSIERSVQEDTLLVLFNTAISNLVLFRNNFAISRDISNLFQSFQSSSSVLDPAVNPTLFQSALVIIIKDVIDSDTAEIRREFALKFQKMVQDEQASNFLTRLHKGQLSIIPWPVIESRHFYSLFGVLKKQLDGAPPTYKEAGMFLHTLKVLMAKLKANDWGSMSQSIASHRAQHLLSFLPHALAHGAAEIEPEYEPLRNLDTNSIIATDDSDTHIWVRSLYPEKEDYGVDQVLQRICQSWPSFDNRLSFGESFWQERLTDYLDDLVTRRLHHVMEWINSNIGRFTTTGSHAAIDNLRRAYELESVEIRRAMQLCKTQCASCHLLCIRPKHHDGNHDCTTDHSCPHLCEFVEEHFEAVDVCYLPAGHGGEHICNALPHLCGEICQLENKPGCQGRCTKNASHDDEHLCSARTHACGQPCDLDVPALEANYKPPCGGFCIEPWNHPHDRHLCNKGSVCPFSCTLCKRLCATADHLHGLDVSTVHLCDQEHVCQGVCASKGICEIQTQPQSVEATFTGRHETFQYTKYSQVAKRLPCAVIIPPGALEHEGTHSHSTEEDLFHYCETRCESCGYWCTLPRGHPQQKHQTSHGSMSRTYWAIADPDGVFEVEGHKFGSNDDGAPMLCSLFCRNMGRHVHVDYCRAQDEQSCSHPETQHALEQMNPNPNRPKDWITHHLYWSRLGFVDPYAKDEQINFAKCGAQCSGPEHEASSTRPAHPSLCILPVFHPPEPADSGRVDAVLGYVSGDGHAFMCKNPSVMTQAFHVIFVIDRSSSMSANDKGPLPNTPCTARILASANNRFGAVCSSLFAFWTARAGAARQISSAGRKDAYSVILFDRAPITCLSNDFNQSPDELLDAVLAYRPSRGTSFNEALLAAQNIMEEHWSTERMPVVIFLSDGECRVGDDRIYDICRAAVRLGKPLSFHAVSFGRNRSSYYLRRMARIAQEVASAAPRDPLRPNAPPANCQYTEALDTVNLAETFLGIADSLTTPHASLLRA